MTHPGNPAARSPFSFVRSIFFKCVLLLVASCVLITGYVIHASTQAAQQINSETIMSFGSEKLEHVARQSAPLLAAQEGDALSALIEDTFANMGESATGILVMGADGSVLYEEVRDDNQPATMRNEAQEALRNGTSRENADRLVVARPIRSGPDNAVVGIIAADWSTDASQATVNAAKKTVWLTALALSTVLIGLCAWMITATLKKPMFKLAQATHKLVSGNFELDVPNFAQGNELRPLSSALTEFRAQLEGSAKTRKDAAMKNAALDAGSAAIMVADQDFKIVYASKTVTTLLSQHRDVITARIPAFNPDDIIGQSIDIFHKKPDMQRNMLSSLGAEGHDARLEMDDVTLELKISRIDDDTGERIGYVVEWADVSQQYLNAAILKSLNENQARAEFGPEGQLVDGNETFLAMVGIETPGQTCSFSDTVFINETPADPAAAAFGEITIKGTNGTVSHLLGGLSPVTFANGSLKRSVLIAADVTAEFQQRAEARRDRAQLQAEQDEMIRTLSDALSQLADGNLTTRIEDPFAGSNDVIRQNFNKALQSLDEAIDSVVSGTKEIQAEVVSVASSADDLSRRTESQAATLEETAAAVTEISASVSSTAKGAKDTNDVVSSARKDAQQSEKVVHDAVKAMAEISKSASEIQSIVKVIDDIAFQTNLLALNAGVEAARAGDAGLGFAVVASEVRALALRSSEAASEIGGLIASSTEGVKLGSELVGKAGSALEQIIASISEISEYVAQIANASQEQSSSVIEITSAMNQLDQVTQQNAAMFEETTAASQNLSRVADELTLRVGRFSTVSKQSKGSWHEQGSAYEAEQAARSA